MSIPDYLLVLEPAMPHRITQPTKEQVRAYMAARLVARRAGRRPPPSPEEIRALLGWRLMRADVQCLPLQFYLIPTAYTRLATTLACDFLLAAMKISCVATQTHQNLLKHKPILCENVTA
ncbi:hypothetical protein KY495_02710 [Massilia sp. PAMC28688]|uniref:hypothetical protein n=1 Tax=Massilia sp. PAMC28688 TaxID=2861283 RepID=UPI001C63A097|nr:hypothetical protein [Massilia sp. PAMC28688]QYF94162.1 hypothetical protein KY495_02710 [Massilia sp. PAMC28688]